MHCMYVAIVCPVRAGASVWLQGSAPDGAAAERSKGSECAATCGCRRFVCAEPGDALNGPRLMLTCDTFQVACVDRRPVPPSLV